MAEYVALVGYIILGASILVPFAGVWVFIQDNKLRTAQDFTALTMVGLFIFVTMATIGLIVLSSNKTLSIDPAFLKYLAGATIAEVAGMCTIIVKAYFSSPATSVPAINSPAIVVTPASGVSVARPSAVSSSTPVSGSTAWTNPLTR